MIVKNAKLFNIDDLQGCWPWTPLMVCRPCAIRWGTGTNPATSKCPKCGREMEFIHVTEEMFATWLEQKDKLRILISGKRPKPDFHELSLRAEHEISYSAKRAIQMYIPVWETEPAYYLFLKCAQAHVLCQGEIEQCRYLMREYGMVEAGA